VGRINGATSAAIFWSDTASIPFRIRDFIPTTARNTSNHEVNKLLKDLLIEFTKSRACRSQDNAL